MKEKIKAILEEHTYHVEDYKPHKNLYAIDKCEFDSIATEILGLFDVSVNEVEFCTCGNPSGEGNIQMVNDEELLYFCCDCNKQVQN